MTLEWLVVLLAMPLLAFPTLVPWLTVVILALVLARLVVAGVIDRQEPGLGVLAGPLRIPWIILGLSMLVGSFISPLPVLTLPKLSGMVLGMLVLRAVLLTASSFRQIRILMAAYLLLGTGALLGGLTTRALGSELTANKFDVLYSIDREIPRVLLGLPGAESGVNTNALGGAALWILPLSMILALHGLRNLARSFRENVYRAPAIIKTAGFVAAAAASFMVLLLSQSRGAWLAAGAAGLSALAFRYRSFA